MSKLVECPNVGRPIAGATSRSCRCRIIRTRRRWPRSRSSSRRFPPLVFAGEARNLKTRAGARRRRRGFPAAGRRLRRKLRRARRQQYPRFLPRVPADGGGADLAGGVAGGEGRPHRRAVRQAALLADREARRHRAAELSRRHHQRQRLHRRRRARPTRAASSRPIGSRRRRSTCCAPSPQGGYANLANVHHWMLGFVKDSPQSQPLPGTWPTASPRRSASCAPAASIREAHPELRTTDFYTSHEALLLGYEQAMTPRRFDHRRLVLHLRPYAVDRRPHAPARSRPCRVLPRHQESARAQMRAVAQGRRSAAADRHSQSRQRARPADADLPLRRRQGRRASAAR